MPRHAAMQLPLFAAAALLLPPLLICRDMLVDATRALIAYY